MFRAIFRASERAKAGGSEYFTVIEDQAPLRIALKVGLASWVAYKLGSHAMNHGACNCDVTTFAAGQVHIHPRVGRDYASRLYHGARSLKAAAGTS
jgi:hypothetical protein